MISEEPSVKKRRRTPLSCAMCRRRKVKCDRYKPRCQRCTKANLECIYTAPVLWSHVSNSTIVNALQEKKVPYFVSSLNVPNISKSSLNNAKQIPEISGLQAVGRDINYVKDKLEEIKELESQIQKIKASLHVENDSLSLVLDHDNRNITSFASKGSVRFTSLGTFTTTSIWKRDPLMQHFIKTLFLIKRIAFESKGSGTETVAERYYPKSLKTLKIPDLERFEFLNSQVKFKKQSMVINDLDELLVSIENILPPMKVIHFLLDHFMKFIYPFISVIDEEIFRKNLDSLFFVNSITPSKTELKISSKLDLAIVASLLLIIRMSYLSIYLKTQTIDSEPSTEVKSALCYPLNADILNLVHSVLHKLNFMRKSSIEILQAMLLLKYYQSHACEDGDGYFGENGTIFTGLVCSVSRMVGLHKEFQPLGSDDNTTENLSSKTKYQMFSNLKMNLLSRGTKPYINLWKKLWQQTLEMDLTQSTSDGSAPFLDHHPNEYSNKLTILDLESRNCLDTDTEGFVFLRMKNYFYLDYEISELMERLHSYKEKPTILEIEERISKIESIAESVYSETKPFPYQSLQTKLLNEVNCIKSKLEVFNCLLTIQYMLLLHSEHIGLNDTTKDKGNQRFKMLFAPTILKWINLADMTVDTWRKITHSISPSADDLNEGYTDYIIILAPVIFSVYTKLVSVLFYLSIRILVFTHVTEESSFSSVDMDTLRKVEQYKFMYDELLYLMKMLVMTQEKMSTHWYISLRNYAMFSKLVEWFETGGKFTLNYASETTDTGEVNLIEHEKNKEAKGVISEYLASVDFKTIEDINSAFSQFRAKHDMDLLNQNNAVEKPSLSSSMDDNSLDFRINDDMIRSAKSPKLQLSTGATPSADSNHFTLLQPTELADWDAVTDWFNQSLLFDPMDVFSFNN